MRRIVFPLCLALTCIVASAQTEFFGIPVDPARPSSTPVPPVKEGTIARPAPPTVATANLARAETFGGIPWGASVEEAQRMMKLRHGVTLNAPPAPNRLEYRGGTFAGRPIKIWGMDFANGRLYRGAVLLERVGEVEAQYQELKKLLIEKYGGQTTENREGGIVVSEWKLAPTLTSKSDRRLRCAIVGQRGDRHTKLVYINDGIANAPAGDKGGL